MNDLIKPHQMCQPYFVSYKACVDEKAVSLVQQLEDKGVLDNLPAKIIDYDLAYYIFNREPVKFLYDSYLYNTSQIMTNGCSMPTLKVDSSLQVPLNTPHVSYDSNGLHVINCMSLVSSSSNIGYPTSGTYPPLAVRELLADKGIYLHPFDIVDPDQYYDLARLKYGEYENYSENQVQTTGDDTLKSDEV